jgi:outer membrane protein assembly factor BamB
MVGNTFIQIRLADGKITQQMDVHFPVSTSAARTKDRIFLGGYDKKFYCLRASDGITLWQTLCPAEPTGTVTVSGDKVYFVCKDDTLYISKTDERTLVWKVPTAGDVPGVAVAEDLCYLPSADTALYCIAPESQKLVWKHLTGGSLVEPPVLTAGAIYQPLKHAALLCLNRNDGSHRWQLADGHNLLAENGTLSYIFTLDRELAVMNNQTGKRELSFYLPSLQLFASNTEDPSIYLAGREGTILVLMPAQIETK